MHTTANPATHHFRLEHINLGAELVLLGIVKLLVRSALCLVLSLHNRAREKPHQQRLESKWKAKLTTTFFATTVTVGSIPRLDGSAGADASFLASAILFLVGTTGAAPTTIWREASVREVGEEGRRTSGGGLGECGRGETAVGNASRGVEGDGSRTSSPLEGQRENSILPSGYRKFKGTRIRSPPGGFATTERTSLN